MLKYRLCFTLILLIFAPSFVIAQTHQSQIIIQHAPSSNESRDKSAQSSYQLDPVLMMGLGRGGMMPFIAIPLSNNIPQAQVVKSPDDENGKESVPSDYEE